MKIDIIMPVRNEASIIQASIQAIHDQPELQWVHVVDGQSQDDTLKKTLSFDKVCRHSMPPNRGAQCDHGGHMATADVLLFLHVDARLPKDWAKSILHVLQQSEVVGGAFQINTKADPAIESWVNPLVCLGNLRSRYTKRPYGDQAIFVRKSVFQRVGGYPHQPLFEDYEFSCRMATQGRIYILKNKVTVSGRRMQKRPLRTLLYNNTFPLLYKCGVSATTLKRWYK